MFLGNIKEVLDKGLSYGPGYGSLFDTSTQKEKTTTIPVSYPYERETIKRLVRIMI